MLYVIHTNIRYTNKHAFLLLQVNVGSPAERAGLVAGDSVIKINNTDVFNLRHKDAQDVIVRAGGSFEMTVQR